MLGSLGMMMQMAAEAASTPPATTADAIERLGVASVLVIAAAWMIRFFIGLLEKKELRIAEKDGELKALTGSLLEVTTKLTSVITMNTDELRETRRAYEHMAEALTELKGALRRGAGQ
jgi:hypothetical protein